MIKNKINFTTLVSVILAFLILGISFAYYTFNKKIIMKNVGDTPLEITNTISTSTESNLIIDTASTTIDKLPKLFNENKEWYTATIQFPDDNNLVKSRINQMWEDFASENELKKYKNYTDAKKGLNLFSAEQKYIFDAKYKTIKNIDSKSYIYEIYTYTGGAHGSTSKIAINLDKNNNEIKVEELLPTNKLNKISQMSFKDLQKQKTQKLREAKVSAKISEKDILNLQKNDEFLNEGTKPIRDNYSIAWVDGEDVVIFFGQYQVASYAEGTFEVRIPKSQI